MLSGTTRYRVTDERDFSDKFFAVAVGVGGVEMSGSRSVEGVEKILVTAVGGDFGGAEIGRLEIGRLEIGRLEIGRLEIGRLEIIDKIGFRIGSTSRAFSASVGTAIAGSVGGASKGDWVAT